MIGSDDNDRRGRNRAEWTWYSAERSKILPDAQGTTLADMIGKRLQTLYPAASAEEPKAIHDLLAQLAAKGI